MPKLFLGDNSDDDSSDISSFILQIVLDSLHCSLNLYYLNLFFRITGSVLNYPTHFKDNVKKFLTLMLEVEPFFV